MGNQQGIPENIRQRFPNLEPIAGPPSLWTVNGFGVGMYGKRDYDRETETYVKTRCVCAVFVPLFALGAYRVADAGARSWFFFGQERLSGFARTWNKALGGVAALVILTLVWNTYSTSPGYRARQDLHQAAQLMKAGEAVKAAGIYRRQLHGPRDADARTGLKDAISACLRSDQPQTVAGGLRVLAAAPADVNQPRPLVPDLGSQALARVTRFRTTDPDGALEVLTAASAFDPKSAGLEPLELASLKRSLLREVVAAKPDNVPRVVELALIYEASDQLAQAIQVLQPCQTRLGVTEGARILGQHLLREGRNDESYALLFPYVQSQLDRLHSLEQAYTNALTRVSQRALDDLRHGRADRAFYDRYDRAPKAQQQEMVDEYIEQQLQRDTVYLRAIENFKSANRIVHVALDLGIVQLGRAQNLADPAARKTELEAAEKTFLSVRGFAGQTDEYRMFLGQVYYWLGKSAEGRQLFDKLLAANQRAFRLLLSLAQTLRAVGEYPDARALAEEAYQSGKVPKEKYTAAALRALIQKDSDDQIAWLEKADPEDNWIQIELNGARGKRALHAGKLTEAATFLQNAIHGYDKLPKSASTLNNCALVCFDLYAATRDLALYKRGTDLLDEAVGLAPGDSILLQNTLFHLLGRAVSDVVQDAIHPEFLGEQPGFQLLAHLYENETERAPIYQKLRENESMKKALAYLDKALLLAPKHRALYSTAISLQSSLRDLAELQKIQQRFRLAAPDFQETRAATFEQYAGTNDARTLALLTAQIRRHEDALLAPEVRNHPLTLEHATVALINLRLQSWACGGTVDPAQLLSLALATDRKHRSSATRSVLQSVCFFAAQQELAQQNAEFAALRARVHRGLPANHLLALVLTRGGALADLVRGNANLRQAVALTRESIAKFPSWVSIEEWAMLSATEPAAAAEVAARYRQNKLARLMDELQYEFNPLAATTVLEQHWVARLLGDENRAREVYQQALREGVPLPPP